MTIGIKRHKNCTSPRHFYKDYAERNTKEMNTHCDYTTYMLISRLILKKFKDYIILEGGVWNLPYRLGRIAVTKKKTIPKRLPIDWAETRLEGVKIVNFNDHSNGYRYKAYWNKKRAIVKNKTYYSFYFVRGVNRELAKAIKNKTTDYFQFL